MDTMVEYLRPQSRLERFLAYIERRLSDVDFRLTDVASEFRLSDRYVRRIFEGARETPSEYIRRRRLELAARMLQAPESDHHTILTIALECGFNDAAYFSRCFHQCFGMTPRNFRKTRGIRQGPDDAGASQARPRRRRPRGRELPAG